MEREVREGQSSLVVQTDIFVMSWWAHLDLAAGDPALLYLLLVRVNDSLFC